MYIRPRNARNPSHEKRPNHIHNSQINVDSQTNQAQDVAKKIIQKSHKQKARQNINNNNKISLFLYNLNTSHVNYLETNSGIIVKQTRTTKLESKQIDII